MHLIAFKGTVATRSEPGIKASKSDKHIVKGWKIPGTE